MPISSTNQIDTLGFMRSYRSTADMSATAGGATEYYKCATVDASTKTWTGYKAVLSWDVYTFEAIATSGLTYTTTPVVGGIYNATGDDQVKLKSSIPTDHVFYASLSADMAASESGHALTKSDSPAYVSDSMLGRNVLDCSGGGALYIPTSFFPTGANPWTLSCLAKKTSSGADDTNGAIFGFYAADNRSVWLGLGNNDADSGNTVVSLHGAGGYNFYSGNTCKINTWYSIIASYDGKLIKVRINGIVTGIAKPRTLDTVTNSVNAAIGRFFAQSGGVNFGGYLASFRIFNRAVSDVEAYALALEYAY